ncbi:putative Zn finger-like uncharacterized protein [Geothermobacter ehrlichii]|uniref:Putative Zn finger-like uncharacterized protein n=1 Tax=Geothermobacter ehrlichii TaxID=213224 RepID=A0A5D3WHZ4_9BACT|nr:DUF3426 domain-containing protein [Geothermobacter ehrlichii]TYO96345.1 putative Zn finger-like uncharacterized protein [Geothermobacter ehrlichii]
MIIQCEACQTRFRLAEEKLKPGGVKVRCSRCGKIFAVPGPSKPPAAPPKPAQPPSEPRPETAKKASNAPAESGGTDRTAAETGGDEFDFDEFNMESFDEEPTAETPAPSAAGFADIGDELPDLDLPDDFSFDDEPGQKTDSTFDTSADQAESGSGDDLLADFSPDDLLDETERLDAPVPVDMPEMDDIFSSDNQQGHWDASAIEPGEPHIGGDLGKTYEMGDDLSSLPEVDFPDPGEIDQIDLDAEESPGIDLDAAPSLELGIDDAKTAVDDTPPADDFVFEEEPAAEPPPTEPVPTRPTAETTADPPARKRTSAATPRTGRAQPGLNRRRKKKKSRALPLFLLFLLVLAGAYAYLADRQGTWDPVILAGHLQQMIDKRPPEDPTAHIELRNLKGFFVTNQSAGQIFAISGEAVNRYRTTRSAMVVKGIIYDRKGKPVVQQKAFCGNPLDEAALRTLPYSKIEESMNNQFGDSLSNLDVAPGKAVPFTIVFRNLPGEVAEFTVVVVDSRPGTQ